METIEKTICRVIHDYMKENISNIKPFSIFDKEIKWIHYGYLSEEDFFECISTEIHDALWCLTELMNWGMNCNHMKNFLYKESNDYVDFNVFKVEDRYFKIVDDYYPLELKLIQKTIIIDTFEEL